MQDSLKFLCFLKLPSKQEPSRPSEELCLAHSNLLCQLSFSALQTLVTASETTEGLEAWHSLSRAYRTPYFVQPSCRSIKFTFKILALWFLKPQTRILLEQLFQDFSLASLSAEGDLWQDTLLRRVLGSSLFLIRSKLFPGNSVSVEQLLSSHPRNR